MRCARCATTSRGHHNIWPDLDLYGSDDAALAWWDPNATGVDEVGQQGKGLYQYTDKGKRYLRGEWPDKAIKLFDPSTTVAIFDQLPARDQAPDYPSPCGG